MMNDHGDETFSLANLYAKPGQVLGLKVSTTDSSCGLCCYPFNGVSASISQQYAISPEATQCISLEEVNSFVREVNEILSRTHLPMFPLLFMHCIIPFSPICFLSCAASSRQKKLLSLIERTNESLKSRNCHWELGALHQKYYGARYASGNTVLWDIPLVILIRHDLMSVTQQGSTTGAYPVNMEASLPVSMNPSMSPYGVPAQTGQIHQSSVGYPAAEVQMPQRNYPGGYSAVSMNNKQSAL